MDQPEVHLNISAVERETGLSKDVLRIWERRYGFPEPKRDDNAERQYPPEQVAKLRAIKRLMDTGMRPGKLMRRSLAEPLPEPRLPDGITLRNFVPGRDEDEWLAVNAAAFAHHPEQGGWTRDELEHREAQPWFDPAGFFLAVRAGRVAGFHWTKIHTPAGAGERAGADEPADAGEPTGEVYVVGVHPAEQGTGLGRALTLAGLHYLRGREIPSVMLYVDGENTAAIRLYASLGFAHADTDVMYQHAAGQP